MEVGKEPVTVVEVDVLANPQRLFVLHVAPAPGFDGPCYEVQDGIIRVHGTASLCFVARAVHAGDDDDAVDAGWSVTGHPGMSGKLSLTLPHRLDPSAAEAKLRAFFRETPGVAVCLMGATGTTSYLMYRAPTESFKVVANYS